MVFLKQHLRLAYADQAMRTFLVFAADARRGMKRRSGSRRAMSDKRTMGAEHDRIAGQAGTMIAADGLRLATQGPQVTATQYTIPGARRLVSSRLEPRLQLGPAQAERVGDDVD
jgi:hypothetical protein